MGSLNSKIESQLKSKQNQEASQLVHFIQLCYMGNFYEANKAQSKIEKMEGKTIISSHVIQLFKRLTWAKNNGQFQKLKSIDQQADTIIDLAKWQKLQTLDELFAQFKQEYERELPKKDYYINEPSPELKAFLNVVWLGKYMLKAYLYMKDNKQMKLPLQKEGIMLPDVEIYNIVSSFSLFMSNIRSFQMLKRIFDGEIAIQFLTHPHIKQQYSNQSFDKFFFESANQFKYDITLILQKIKLIFNAWRELFNKFLSKEQLINLIKNQKTQFYSIVNRLHQLIQTKLSDRSNVKEPNFKESNFREPNFKESQPQMAMNLIQQRPAGSLVQRTSQNQAITKLKQKNQLLQNQNKVNIKKIQAKDQELQSLRLQISQIKQLNLKELQQKEQTIMQLKQNIIGKANAPSIQHIKTQLKNQYQHKLSQSKQQWEEIQSKKIEKVLQSLTKGQNQVHDLLNQRKSRSTTESSKKESNHQREKINIDYLPKQIDQTFSNISGVVKIFTKQTQQSIDELNNEIAILKANIKSLQQINKNSQKEKNSLNQLNRTLKSQNDSLVQKKQSQKTRHEQEIASKTQQIKQKFSLIETLNKQSSSLKEQINALKKKIEQLQRIIKTTNQEHQEKVSSSLNEIKNLKSQINDRNFQYTQKCLEIQKLTHALKKDSRCYTQYFNGHILNINSNDYLQWFVQNMQSSTKKRIRATYPVYRFDRDNKNSFHNYVDNKPQIVLIVKIANGQVIAGYSEPPFKPKTNIDFRPGFMFAFRNKKIFTVKKEPTTKFNKTQPKPITYDEYFLMWGNSDIRIKSGSDEFFSGYATANCCYEERGNENSVVDDLILQDDRQTTLVDYELFQVEFENGDNFW